MKTLPRSFRAKIGIALLMGALSAVQACSSDGKKKSRTEDALEKTGDAMAADAKDFQAKAKEKIREADEKLTGKSQDAGSTFRYDRDVVVANIKKRTRELDAKLTELQDKAKQKDHTSTGETAKLNREREDLNDDLRKAQSATADAWRDVKKSFKRAGDKLKNN